MDTDREGRGVTTDVFEKFIIVPIAALLLIRPFQDFELELEFLNTESFFCVKPPFSKDWS